MRLAMGATGANVINSINNNRAMVVYSGHGSQSGWAGPSLSQSDVRNLTGMAVPYVASHACVTGDFLVNESFADTWIIEPETVPYPLLQLPIIPIGRKMMYWNGLF